MITNNNTNINFGKFPRHLLFGITTKANDAMQQAVQTAKRSTVKATEKVTNDFYQPSQRVQRFNPLSEFFEGISRILG